MIVLAAPCVSRYDLLQDLLDSAEQGTRKPDRYVVVDNGGKITSSGVRLPANTDVISPGRNLGVSASWNSVMERYPDTVIFSNDDIVLHPNTIEVLEGATHTTDADFIYVLTVPPATFGVFLITHAGWRKVGKFDERFWPCYFEDVDYHRRIQLANLVEFAVTNTSYEHLGNAFIKSLTATEREALHVQVQKNAHYYSAKWGGPPGQETLGVPNEVPL